MRGWSSCDARNVALDSQPFAPTVSARFARAGSPSSPTGSCTTASSPLLHDDELVLYFLLVLAGDRNGLRFYHYDSLCSLAGMTLDRYIAARNALIDKDLVAFDGRRFQVLSLPRDAQPLQTQEELEDQDPATARLLIQNSLRDATKSAT